LRSGDCSQNKIILVRNATVGAPAPLSASGPFRLADFGGCRGDLRPLGVKGGLRRPPLWPPKFPQRPAAKGAPILAYVTGLVKERRGNLGRLVFSFVRGSC
jgi:hypothetical protein